MMAGGCKQCGCYPCDCKMKNIVEHYFALKDKVSQRWLLAPNEGNRFNELMNRVRKAAHSLGVFQTGYYRQTRHDRLAGCLDRMASNFPVH